MTGAAVCQFLLLLFHKSLTSHVVFRSGRPRAPVEAGSVGVLTRAHERETREPRVVYPPHGEACFRCMQKARENDWSALFTPRAALGCRGRGLVSSVLLFLPRLALGSRRQSISHKEVKIQNVSLTDAYHLQLEQGQWLVVRLSSDLDPVIYFN